MVQWPFRTAGINAPSPTAPALAPPRKRVCYWLTRLKRHFGDRASFGDKSHEVSMAPSPTMEESTGGP
jgi:hypothetical protein